MKTHGLFICVTTNALWLNFRWGLVALSLFFTFFLNSYSLLAQVKLWDKIYGGSDSETFGIAKPTSDGGFILGGTSYSGISGDKTQGNRTDGDYWVIKLKANGAKEWDKTFGGGDADGLESLQQTQDGGYILAGYSYSNKSGDKTQESKGGIDYWIVKLNAKGNKVWDKTFGGENTDWLSTVQQTPDGGYILGGYSNSGKSGDKSEANKGADQFTYDYWILKLDATGNKVWDKTFGGDHSDNLATLVTTPDGGYLLGGSSSSGKSGDKSRPRISNCTYDLSAEPCPDYWVVKITANGVKQWDKTFAGNQIDRLQAISPTADGGYLLGGTSESGKNQDKSDHSRDNTEDEAKGDYWIIKIKADGTKVWDKTFGGNKIDRLTALQPTPDGGFLLGGYTNSDISPDMTEVRREVESFWVIKINNKGSKQWDKSVSDVNLFVNSLKLDLLLTPEGNCLVAGQTLTGPAKWEKSQPGKGALDFWVVKLQIPDKKAQTIAFKPTDQGLSTTPYKLTAKASSGLPVTFRLLSGPATQQGNQLKFTGYGSVVVKVSQAGNATYSPVEYTTSFRVQRFTTLPDKTIGGDSTDRLADMLALPDGGYLLAGTSYSGKSGDKSTARKDSSDYWLVKVDADKNKIWDKSYGGKGLETLSVIVSTADGGYLLGGSSSSGKGDGKSGFSKGKADYWLVKINAAGEKIWDQTYGGNLDDNLSVIVATEDGGYLLGGSSKSGKSGDKSESNKGSSDLTDFWVVKINSQGNKIWDKTFGNPYEDRLSDIILTPDGNYLLGGSRDDENQLTDYWIIKINSAGQSLWNKSYDRDWLDRLTTLTTTSDGGYLLGGYSGTEEFYYWVIKTNATGGKVWDRTYGGNAIFPCAACVTNSSFLVDIVPTSTHNYLLAGYTHSDRGSSRSEENRGHRDYWLLEIDENGQKIADKSFGSQRTDELATIVATPNGGYLLGGSSNSDAGFEKSEDSKGNYDFWLVETNVNAFPPATLEAWNLRFGGSSHDNFTTMLPTADGGYLLGGYSYSNQSGDKSQNSRGKSDYWVVKTDAAGKKLWDKRYGGSSEDYLNSMLPTPDGGFLLGGSSESGISGDKTQASKGNSDIWVVKITSSGEKEWDQSYGGSGSEDLRKIKNFESGNTFLLVGHSNSPKSGDKTENNRGGYDYWIIKIQGFNGFKYWDKRFGGSGHDYLEDALELENGDFLLGGTSYSGANGDKSQASRGSSDYWLVRTTSEGQKLWDKCYGGSGQDQLFSLLTTHKDSILLAGHSASGKEGDKTQLSRGSTDFWLLQVNSTGQKQWDKAYGGTGKETLRSFTINDQGDYLLGGTSLSGKSGDKSQTSQGSSDYWLVKTNTMGTKIWDKRFGGSNEEELRSVWQTDDGGYLLGGRSNSGSSGDKTQTNQGGNDYWLIKVVPEATPSLIAAKQPDINKETISLSQFLALNTFPNPFAHELTINFRVPQTQLVSLKVYNSQGQEITTLFQGEAKAAQEYACKWQAGKYAEGIYILRLQGKEHNSHQRVVLTR